MYQYEAVNAALARPERNLFGQFGPRCPTCSGLGKILRLTGDTVTKSTSQCKCYGSGLDIESLQRQQVSGLIQRMEMMEKEIQRLDRVNKELRSQTRIPPGKMSRQYWMECISWATADGTAVANTTTETIGFPNITIPSNYMQDGRALRLRLFGRLSTTSTPTMIFALRWGGVSGTLLATTEAITNGSGITSVNWAAELLIQTRSNGATGTLFAMGEVTVQTNASGDPTVKGHVFSISGADLPAAATCDLTADTALSFTNKWSAASASNTSTGHLYLMESMN